MSTWQINGNPPGSLAIVGGQFKSGSASTVRLRAPIGFDDAELFAYGSNVTILRDGAAYFKGKVRRIPKSGRGNSEFQDYIVEDVWAELERLTYQEPWLIRQTGFSGVAYSPTVVLGINSAGTRINVGEQISEVLDFAVDQGLDLIAGTMPTGMNLWPSEVTGMSCAAVIRDCLKYYPDWIPWIDHTTTPPTFNVTPRATANPVSVVVTDCTDIDVTRTDDRVPDGVRIVYLTATMIGDAVYRTMKVDQYPAVSESELAQPAGPGILTTTVELQGMRMQIQKQQVMTRDLPESSTDAKAYLKLKFPQVKDLADTDWNITAWTTTVVPEDEDDEAAAIDPKLERKVGADRTDLPRELVKGNVAEWMQRKVGRVLVQFKATASGTATEDERKAIESLPPYFSVVATNATTKVYKGVSSYTAGEDAPAGIAEAYFVTISSGCNYEGSITITGDELPSARFHGSKISLTGSLDAGWASMGAPIHSVSWDLASAETTVSFGPNPDYSVNDFLEFLRLLNKREQTSYTVGERTGDELGGIASDGKAGISANGDSVGAYDTPETIVGGGTGGGFLTGPFYLSTVNVGGVWKYNVSSSRSSITDGTNGPDVSISGLDAPTTISASKYIVITADIDEDLVATGWAVSAVDDTDIAEVKFDASDPPKQEELRIVVGKVTFETVGAKTVAVASQALFSNVIATHGILNGLAVRVADMAPAHPDIL